MFDRNKGARQNSVASKPNSEDTEVRKSVIATASSAHSKAVIGATVRITGDIISDENLIIEGLVEGTITLNSHELTIGSTGQINANINARIVRIDGQVQGDIVGTEKVIITKTGNVRGNIVAPAVSLEDGAKFKGSIDMGSSAGNSSELPLSELGSISKVSRAINDQAKNTSSITAERA